MADISELVINIRTDGVKQSSDQIDVLTRREREAERDTKKLGDSFAAFNLIINRLPGPLKTGASAIMGLVNPAQAAVGVLLDLGDAAVGFAKESLAAFSDFEMIKTNLELVMGSADKASATFGELRAMAGKTPFDVEGLADAAVQLKQTGTSTQELIPVLTMLGNTAGGSADKFNRLVGNFAQIQSVGKTTAMDLKQFAMMGIPIYDVLQKMGVQGNATAGQIKTAFQEMTKEGGTFYNAMEKGAETLQGKTTNLQGVWKSFLANFAETSGLADFWKGVLDEITKVIVKTTEANAAIADLNKSAWRVNDGAGSAGDHVKVNNVEMTRLQNEIKYLETAKRMYSGSFTEEEERTLEIYKQQLKELEEETRHYESLMAAEAARAALIEETNRKFEDTNKSYAAGIADIDAKYAQTEKGRVEAIQEEINKYREYLNLKRQEKLDIPGGGVQIATYGISDEEKKKIEAIIELLNGQLNSALKKNKENLADWQKILKQALSVEDVSTEENAVAEYLARIGKEENTLEPLSRLLGFDELDHYNAKVNETKNAIATLLQSGLWEENKKTVQDLLAVYDQYKTKVDEINELEKRRKADESFNEEMYAIAQEIALLEKLGSKKEATKAIEKEKFKAAGVAKGWDEGQIQAAWDAEQLKADTEKNAAAQDYVNSLREQLELLVTSREEREKQLLIEQGFSPEQAKQAVELKKQIELVQALIQVWENMKTQLIELGASGFVEMMGEIGQAFRDGALSANEMSTALGNYVKKIMNAIPQLLLQAGLQMMMVDWKIGLALIAASGLASFVSGLAGSDDADKQADDTLEQLRRLQDQITQLIDAQKEQAEYYLQRQRSISAGHAINTYSVNDAIITPGGVVNTAPDDYILAMKHPETLMSGNGGTVVNVNVINNSSAQVEVQENKAGEISEIMVMIKNDIKRDFATGGFDGAYDAMQSRRGGIRRNA